MSRKIKTSQKWAIGKKTPHRKELSKGDKVLFYQGGEVGQKIVGSAELASRLIRDEKHIYDFVMVRNFELWEKPVGVKAVMNKLSFVREQKYWGAYFQSGILRILERDYRRILEKAHILP